MKCVTTREPMTRAAMCMLCGVIMCDSCYACQHQDPGRAQGSCKRHMQQCGGSQGMFLLMQKCIVLFLAKPTPTTRTVGCLLPAPYKDQYGEADFGLKRGAPLFLDTVAYARLRDTWVRQTVYMQVARKLVSESSLADVDWDVL